MKRFLLILILGIGLYRTSYAQYFFNKRETLHSFASTLTSVMQREGKYYCTGLGWDSSNYVSPNVATYAIGVRFVIFDSVGDILKDSIYQLPLVRNLFPWNNSLYLLPDKGFVYAIGQDNDSGHSKMMILRYDSTGNVLWTKEYNKPFCNDTLFYRVLDFKPTGTGEWLALATIGCPYASGEQHDIVLTKLDSNFDVEWCRRYGSLSLNDIAGRIVVVQDGYVLAGDRNNFNLVQINFSNRAEIIKVDTAGNQQWLWLSDANKLTGTIQDIIQTADGGYVYCGQRGYEYVVAGSGHISNKGWIEKIDSSGNVVWNDSVSVLPSTIDANNQTVLRLLPDKSIILAGQVVGGFKIADTSLGRYNFGSLVKFSSTGSVIWERKYNYFDDTTLIYRVYDMEPTSDGGFVFCGEATGAYNPIIDPRQRGWIIKVDSNGCLGPGDPGCQPLTVNNEQLTVNSVKVWPNPVNNTLNIECGEKIEQIEVYNMQGACVVRRICNLNKEIIDMENLPGGMYLIRVNNLYSQKVVKQ